jgi:uncharacterized membrane protein
MDEMTLMLVAGCCAGIMVALAGAGTNANLRAAVRTTMVVLVGWGFAWTTRGPIASHTLTPDIWIMLVLSCLTVAASWTLYLQRARYPEAGGTLSIDQLNIGFAVLFALTLVGAQPTSQSVLSGLAIVAGTIILARR